MSENLDLMRMIASERQAPVPPPPPSEGGGDNLDMMRAIIEEDQRKAPAGGPPVPEPRSYTDITAGLPRLPDPSKPEETAAGTARKFVENIPPLFKRIGGGLLQQMGEGEGPIGLEDIRSKRPSVQEPLDRWRAREEKNLAELAEQGRELFASATADLQANAPNVDPDSIKGWAYDFAVAMTQMAPAFVASLATRSPTPGMTILGGQVYGDRYGESRAAGRTPAQAQGDATFYALAEAIPERIPLEIIMKRGEKFMPRVVKSMAAEGVQELFTSILQTGYDMGVLEEDMTWGEALKQINREGILGMLMGGTMAGVAHPFTARAERTPEAPPADQPPASFAQPVEVQANVNLQTMQGIVAEAEAGGETLPASEGGVDAMIAWHGTPHTFPPAARIRDKTTGKEYMVDLPWQEHPVVKANPENFEVVAESEHGMFTTQKIGTGEGHQAYGWGLYFSGEQEVARQYRERLGGPMERRQVRINGTPARDIWSGSYPLRGEMTEQEVRLGLMHIEYYVQIYKDPKEGLAEAKRVADQLAGREATTELEKLEQGRIDNAKRLFEVADIKVDPDVRKGQLYKVDLAPDESEYLYWDRPLSQQSEKVKKALEAIGVRPRWGVVGVRDPYWDTKDFLSREEAQQAADDLGGTVVERYTAERLYEMLVRDKAQSMAIPDAKKAVSLELAAQGIPGIKYLNQGSRVPQFTFDATGLKLFGGEKSAKLTDLGVLGAAKVVFDGDERLADVAASMSVFIHQGYSAAEALEVAANRLRPKNWGDPPFIKPAEKKKLLKFAKRLTPDATYNYVIFDERLIEIAPDPEDPEVYGMEAAPRPPPRKAADPSKLPEDVAQAFTELAEAQRGEPEQAMVAVQFAIGGGVMNVAVEHTGDLIHRMSERVTRSTYGQEFVAEKTKRILTYLRNPYGFAREHEDNMRNNARYWEQEKGMKPGEFEAKVKKALARYVAAHRALPAYNRAQWLAREAAIAIGEGKYDRAEQFVATLDAMVRSPQWKTHAGAFYRNPDGTLREYTRKNAERAERIDRAPTVEASWAPGATYRGMIPGEVTGERRIEPARREKILRKLTKGLGMPLYQGHMKGRMLGFFRHRIQEVRLRFHNDIEVAAHEFAHLLDYKFELRKFWRATKDNKTFREELRGLSYDKKKLYEGFAEFVRHWMTNPAYAQAMAPNVVAWWEDWLSNNKYEKVIRTAAAEMQDWFAQDAATRLASKIGGEAAINDGLDSTFSKWRQGIADDLHGIMMFEYTMTGRLSPFGAYETSRLVRAKHSIVEGVLLYGRIKVNKDGSHSFVGKGLDKILEPVRDRLDDWIRYAVAKSAAELKRQGREKLFTDVEIQGGLALENEDFKRAFKEYQQWNQALLDFAESKGALSAESRMRFRRREYLPFYRVAEAAGGAKTRAIPGDWKGVKTLIGGTQNLRPLLTNIIMNANMWIEAGLVNEARRKVAELAEMEGGARFMVKVPKASKIARVHADEIKRTLLKQLGVRKAEQLDVDMQVMFDQMTLQMQGLVDLFQHGQSPYGPDIVAVLKGGKPTYYQVADPVLYRALSRLQRPARTSKLMRTAMGFKRIGQSSVTLALDFIAANIARDTLMGAVMSRVGFKALIDSARGMKSRIMVDQNYKDYIANGGGFASYLVDETAYRKHLSRYYGSKGINYKTILNTPAKLLFMLERLADAAEMSTRLGEFRKAQLKGLHPRHAAYLAREVSTDFAMRGDWAVAEFFYDTVMFLKPAVVGMDRLYRGFATDPQRWRIMAKSGLIAAFSIALVAWNRLLDEYDELEDWDKDVHWHFFIPTDATFAFWMGEGPEPPKGERYMHFRYPKIWEIGAMASLAERAYSRVMEGKPAEFVADSARIILDTFRVSIIPQFLAPWADIARNRISFIDRPIETETERKMSAWNRAGGGTSPTLRWYGRHISRHFPEGPKQLRGVQEAFTSPKQVEVLLRGYLNTFAAYGLMLSDAAFFDDAPDLRVDQYPVIRRFYSAEPKRSTRYVTEFYDALREATEARNDMNSARKAGERELMQELRYTRENLEFRMLNATNENIQNNWRQMRKISLATSLPDLQDYANRLGRHAKFRDQITKLRASSDWGRLGSLKRALLDIRIQYRNDIAKSAMERLEERRKEPLPEPRS